MPIKIGINGLGRIGKCVLLQTITLNSAYIKICAINTSLNSAQLKTYLTYDSTHHKTDYNPEKYEIISDNKIKVGTQEIVLITNRDATKLNWKKYDCEYVIDATGANLTTEKCLLHNVPTVIITAPPKDNTPSFVYSVNHDKYNNEPVVSTSSCTTNSLAPLINILNKEYGVVSGSFTTIHSTTSSQFTQDSSRKQERNNRSIFNNIIPSTTGASKEIIKMFPHLENKFYGMSVRVPVQNCSLLDITLELSTDSVEIKDIEQLIKNSSLFGKIYNINNDPLVSSDFITTKTPTILDTLLSKKLSNNTFKLFLWYDNEWSYSSQVINILTEIYNNKKNS